MRKGRSQRKTRASIPPLSARSQPSGVGAEASPSSPGPQVVIGITGRPSEVEEVREARGAEPATKPSARIDGPEVGPGPVLEIVGEPVLPAEREPLVDSLSPAVVSEHSNPHVVPDPFALALSEETPLSPSTETSELAAEAGPPPHVPSLATPGDASIPPAGDLSVEPVAERFFSEGEGRDDANDEESWAAAPDDVQRKSLPHVVERRARFSRYVRWAVSGAAFVCLAAIARTALVPHRASSANAGAAMAAVAVEEAPFAPPAIVAVTVTGAESVQAPKVDVPPKVDEPKAAAVDATKPEQPKAPGEPSNAAVTTADKTALEEKTDTRRNLERGKLAEAIEAGERSVALDPQDGEAWLLLGAAYQEKGKSADARRCYKACLSEGKRGPLGECRAMVH